MIRGVIRETAPRGKLTGCRANCRLSCLLCLRPWSVTISTRGCLRRTRPLVCTAREPQQREHRCSPLQHQRVSLLPPHRSQNQSTRLTLIVTMAKAATAAYPAPEVVPVTVLVSISGAVAVSMLEVLTAPRARSVTRKMDSVRAALTTHAPTTVLFKVFTTMT